MPDLSSWPVFLVHAVVASALASVAFGVVGSFVVARRISYIAASISHCVLGGIGAALYFRHAHGLEWCHPMLGAVVSALGAALIIGWVSLRGAEREDTAIGALWAAGMAAGLLFLSQTPAYVDPMSYLFGDVLMISRRDLWLIAGLDGAVVLVAVLFYRKFLAVCFDEEYARVRGLRVGMWYLALLCLTALTVVLLVSVVGIVMVIALLTLPAAVAGGLARKLWQMIVGAVALCLFFSMAGIALSYPADLPTGPTIIAVASVAYLAVAAGRAVWRRLRSSG